MIELTFDWLNQPIPLWAFLVALLTAPTRWAGYAHSGLESAADRYLPER